MTLLGEDRQSENGDCPRVRHRVLIFFRYSCRNVIRVLVFLDFTTILDYGDKAATKSRFYNKDIKNNFN